jgi:hypothetical protein
MNTERIKELKEKIPTRRQYMYDKPYCLVEHDDCSECFESMNGQPNPSLCSNCRIAFRKKNKNEEVKQ